MSDEPIYLVQLSNGDTAEAETPDAIVYAARVLMDDVHEAGSAERLTAAFYAHGRLVRSGVEPTALCQLKEEL